MKNHARTRTIPVVIMTSSSQGRDLAEGYNLGVDSYIRKPVDFDQFRTTVDPPGLYWRVINQAFTSDRTSEDRFVQVRIRFELAEAVVSRGDRRALLNSASEKPC